MKKEKRFDLRYENLSIVDFYEVEELILPIVDELGKKTVKAGRKIEQYEEVLPGIFSPVDGEILGVTKVIVDGKESEALKISVSKEGKDGTALKSVKEFSENSEDEIFLKLNKSGFKFDRNLISGSEIVVSAVETDPLCAVYQQLVKEKGDRLLEYFDLIKKLFNKENIFFIVPENVFDIVWELQTSGITLHKVSPFYPNGIPELLINEIKGALNLENPLYVSIEEVIQIFNIVKTGNPCFNKVITLTDKNGTKNLRVKRGTPVKSIIKNSELKKIKKIIIGGPLRGFATYDINSPVTCKTDSVYIQYEDEIIRAENNQCLNCGKCNEYCPVFLSVNLICRYSEFSLFEKCKELGVENCIECGLCSYYCPSVRSLLQLVRLAKSEIEKLEGEAEL